MLILLKPSFDGSQLDGVCAGWLIARGEVDKAHKILADLHANGLMTDQLVENELEEIIRAIDDEKKNSTSWASMFATAGNRRRMAVLTVIGAGTQLNGNGIVTYYLAPILRSIGITDSTTIAGLLVCIVTLPHASAANPVGALYREDCPSGIGLLLFLER